MRIVPVFFLVTLFAGCDSFGSLSDTEYVNSAQDYLDKGELKPASIELKNALSQNPKNPRARWLLGNLYLDIGNMPGAEKELHKARELGVSEESVLPLLARAYLGQGKYDDVEGLRVQSSFSIEAQASLLTSHGIALLVQGDSNKASESIAAAIRIKPDLPYAIYGQAVMSISSGDLEDVRKLLNQALEYDPEYSMAWGLLGDLEQLAMNPEPAEQAYNKAIENSFNDIDYRFKRIMVRIQLQRFDDAQQDINKLKRRAPNLPSVNYAQGLLGFLQGKYPEAQESFEHALKVDENHMPAVFYLGAAHYALKNDQQANEYLSRFINSHPSYMPARKLLAVLELSQRNYQRVEELARPIVNSNSDDVLALNLLASALLAQGKAEEGIEMLERVTELQPESASAKVRLGVGLLMQGVQTDAVASLESAIELDPEFQRADMLLVMYYLRKKEFDQAQRAAQDFINRQPDNSVAHNLLGLVYIGKKQPEQAKAAFTKAIEIAPGDPDASQNLAALALRDSKPDEARQLYKQVLERHENHLSTLLKLATLEGKQRDAIAMKSTLERAILAHPDAIQPRVLLARNYLLAKNVDKAFEVMGDLGEKHPNNTQVLGVVGEIQLANKDFRAAKITLERLVGHEPRSAQAHYLLAKAYAGLNEKAKMELELARALELAPRHFLALITQTRLQLLNGKLGEAEKNLAILKEEAADNSDVLAIEAALSAKSGDEAQALAVLEQRFQTSPTTKSLLALTLFKWSLGKREEVIVAIEQWVAAHRNDVTARIALADAYTAQGRRDDAIAQYEEILEVSENNLLALNNLAWNLRRSDLERALAYGEKARALDPDSAVIMDTLSELLLAKGKLVRAERMNTRALVKIPNSPTFLFRKARILEAKGKHDESTAVLKRILEGQQTFPERVEAEAMLGRLGG